MRVDFRDLWVMAIELLMKYWLVFYKNKNKQIYDINNTLKNGEFSRILKSLLLINQLNKA